MADRLRRTLGVALAIVVGIGTVCPTAAAGCSEEFWAFQEAGQAEGIADSVAKSVAEFTRVFSLPRILLTAFILIATYLVLGMLTLILQRIADRRRRYAPAIRKTIPILNLVLWLAAFWLVLAGVFGQSTLAIALLIVLLVITAGIALQPLLRDMVGGIVIIFERPFHIGDRVRIGDQAGEVVQIGLRSFRLVQHDGSVVVIPNSEAVRQSVANENPGGREIRVEVELFPPGGVDLELARRAAYDAAVLSPYVSLIRPVEIETGQDANHTGRYKITVRACVFDARYARELKSDIVELAKEGFQPEPP